MLTVVTTTTPEYPRPWVFPTLGLLSARVVCLLDPSDARPLPQLVQREPYVTPGVLYQDGRFLEAVPQVKDDDVVVLADADGVFQRDFSDAERATLAGLGHGVALGYNMHPGQKGEAEYQELRPLQSIEEAAARLDLPAALLRGCWVYNTGLMAAKASTWRRVRRLFDLTVGAHGPGLFRLHSWPQYFLCLTLARHGIPVTELGYETHSHGHFPLTARHAVARRQLYHGGRLVLFAHNVPGVSH